MAAILKSCHMMFMYHTEDDIKYYRTDGIHKYPIQREISYGLFEIYSFSV